MSDARRDRGEVRYESGGHVATVTIERPKSRNAVTPEIARDLEAAIDAIEGDESVWCAVLTGAPPAFCAGVDLSLFETGEHRATITERGGFAGIVRRERRKPLIAAVDGPAIAAGFEIALACDLIVASDAASFALPEVGRGLVPSAGGLVRLPELVPGQVATRMILTGEPIDARRAYELGLVSLLCAPGGALQAATSLAEQINGNSPLAVRECLKILRQRADSSVDTLWRMGFAANKFLATTDDFQEGPRAFLERRAPRFVGK